MVDALPEDPADYPDLRVGDQGIKRKRWYVEGYERFDERGGCCAATRRASRSGPASTTRSRPRSTRCAPTCDLLARELARHGLAHRPRSRSTRSARSTAIEPPLNAWERAHRQDSPEERTAHLHMITYGPDLNLSCAELDPAALVDAGRKLTHYSPWLVPLSFSSPFRDGGPWGGLSARTAVRTGARPAVLVFLDADAAAGRRRPVADPAGADPGRGGPHRVQGVRRLPATRRSTASCSACSPGWCWTTRCPAGATTPDAAAHRYVARVGLADDAVHAGTGELLDAADAALAGRPADLRPAGRAAGTLGAAGSARRPRCWRPTARASPWPALTAERVTPRAAGHRRRAGVGSQL